MQYWIRAAAGMLAAIFMASGQPAADKCRVEGTVLNAVTGQPVRKARITLTPSEGGEWTLAATDAHGKYSFADLPPGKYRLAAMHQGYLGQLFGAQKPGEEQKGEPLELTAGSVKTDVDLKLTPLGSIMGFVRDEDGDPVRQVDVALLVYAHGSSGKKLQIRQDMQTDALGEYRLFDLPPGTYYLRAKPLSAQNPAMGLPTEAYATIYYPNSPHQAGAGTVQLAAGQEQRGIDFVLHSISVASIRGRVIKPAGSDKCSTFLEAASDELQNNPADDMSGSVGFYMVSGSDGQLDGGELPGRQVDGVGNFAFRNVPVGSHSLTAICMAGQQRYTVKLPIQLDAGGMENLELRPVGPSTVTGQLRLEGVSKSKLAEARVSLGQPGGDAFFAFGFSNDSPDGKVAEDGTFSFHNLAPGIYHLNVEPPKDLYVKSIMNDGRDLQDSGVDLSAGGMSIDLQIVLSANGGSIEGSVENGAGAKVILVPSDPQAPRALAKMVLAGPDGRFAFPVVAPGRYKVFAWEEVDPGAAMYDAEFRKPFESKGQAVEVSEKQKATAQLQLIPKVE